MEIQAQIDLFLRSRTSSGKADDTLRWYRDQFRALLVWLDDGQDWLDPDTIENFLLSERQRGLSDRTIHGRYRALRAFFIWLCKREKLSARKEHRLPAFDSPIEYIEAPIVGTHVPVAADAADIDKLLASIGKSDFLGIRDRFVIETLRCTGLRVGDVVGLRPSDFDTTSNFLLVRGGKGDKDRSVPYGNRYAHLFVEYMFARPVMGDTLVLATDGHGKPTPDAMLSNGVRQMLRRRSREAGIKYWNPHSYRHLWAITMLNAGMEATAVSAILGHTSVAFTMKVYARWTRSGLRREYDKANMKLFL